MHHNLDRVPLSMCIIHPKYQVQLRKVKHRETLQLMYKLVQKVVYHTGTGCTGKSTTAPVRNMHTTINTPKAMRDMH